MSGEIQSREQKKGDGGAAEHKLSLKTFGKDAGKKMGYQGGEAGDWGIYAWVSAQQPSWKKR